MSALRASNYPAYNYIGCTTLDPHFLQTDELVYYVGNIGGCHEIIIVC